MNCYSAFGRKTNSRGRIIFLVLISAFACLHANAQYNEFGIQLGASRYKGELSPHLFDTKFIHPAAGIFYRHNWTRFWSWKAELNYGRVSGNDKEQSTGFEHNRNLNFYSDIYDFAFTFEFNFLPFELGNSDFPVSPYIFAGLGLYKFNPKSEDGTELQPLGTEGQGLPGGPDPYNRVAVTLPIGGGIKVALGNVGVALQVSARRSYSDYLDDVSGTYPDLKLLQSVRGPVAAHLSDPGIYRDSLTTYNVFPGKQRGNPADNDWYVFATVNVFIRLNSFIKEFCKPFKHRRYS